MITQLSDLDLNGTYTYADYLKWQFEETVELIRGKIYLMSPAPRRKHQKISTQFQRRLYQLLENRTCEVYNAPFDVRLPNPDYKPRNNQKVFTVVQPDICVICDTSKLDDNGCVGAPEFIIEISSPSTIKRDFNEKYYLYESAGVNEYWIAVPEMEMIYTFSLENDN
ncbi:MAG: Uma2 family endonuclease [Spirosomataceae bacterium]